MAESKKQRLERIAVQLMAGLLANADDQYCRVGPRLLAEFAIVGAQELIKQLDALPIDE